jgi:IS30 family transposase
MTYTHLSEFERYQIERWLGELTSVGEIAKLLARSRSTIYREIKRLPTTYAAPDAQTHRKACASVSAANAPRLQTGLWAGVREQLGRSWSPQQISGRAKYLGQSCPSWQSIYAWTKRVWPERKERPLRHAHKQGGRHGWAHLASPIGQRPAQVKLRQELGHWEADTMLCARGNRKPRVLVAVERACRLTRLARLPNGQAPVCASALEYLLIKDETVPLKSVTVDRGIEFRCLPQLLGKRLYVCDPQRPNQRGTNENTIGLLRQYVPKGTPISTISEQELKRIEHELNNRPRRCLGFKTPLEVLSELNPRCRTSI